MNFSVSRLLPKNFKIDSRCGLVRGHFTAASSENEYSSTPLYPRIEKLDSKSTREIQEKVWHDKIKRQLTVEEKLFEVNVPRYWGWKCFMVNEEVIPYDNLTFTKHMTRTHLIETETLPEHYNELHQKSLILTEKIKSDVIEAIEYQLSIRRPKLNLLEPIKKEKELTKLIINELNRIILNSLCTDENHIKHIQTDYAPRIEASWKINSLVETFVKKQYPNGLPVEKLPEEYLERPSDKYIQYIGRPILQLRHSDPLPVLMDMMQANIFGYSVPVFQYDPHITLGYQMERRHITNIPGFWPGDEREFSFLSYHFSNHVKNRPPIYGEKDAKEVIQSQGIFSSFSWLMGLACYQGFSSYHDVTYPFVTQTVLTDGREFTFAAYQLNTTELYHENPFENSRCNICWATPTASLYETYEDGKLRGFNSDTLKTLLQFYLNSPKPISDVELKPYLGSDIKHIADYEMDEKREWLEKNFKHFSSNRPRGRTDLMYKVMEWEKIFKIQFGSPLYFKKRPYEMGENPYHRKMSDHPGEYIPRSLRPDKDLPKWRQKKFKRTFYPE